MGAGEIEIFFNELEILGYSVVSILTSRDGFPNMCHVPINSGQSQGRPTDSSPFVLAAVNSTIRPRYPMCIVSVMLIISFMVEVKV